MEVTQLAEGVVLIQNAGRQFTGLATYTPTGGLALTKLTGLPRDNGWIVKDNHVSAWNVAGFTRHADRVYLYGDPVIGRTLSEVQRLDWDQLLPCLIRLASAFVSLQHERISTGPIHARSILFTDHGSVLVLPEALSRGIAEQQRSADRMEFQHVYNHPDRGDDENVLFALAVLCYRSLTGVFPFTAQTEDVLRTLMRVRPPLPAQLRAPELADDVSHALHTTLSSPSAGQTKGRVLPGPAREPAVEPAGATAVQAAGRSPNRAPEHLQQWLERLRTWRGRGVHRPLTDEQRLSVRARAVVTERRINRRYHRREFLRTNWQKLVVIVLAVALAGTVPGTIVRNRMQPRATAGMSSTDVVAAYYQSINRLDHSTMEDAVVDDAGRDTIRTVINLYVMSRMRLAVESTTGLVDAEAWRTSGSTALPAGQAPYGIAGLEVRPTYEDNQQAEYLVRYEKWTPVKISGPNQTDAGTALSSHAPNSRSAPTDVTEAAAADAAASQSEPQIVSRGVLRQERVRLRQDHGDWVIYSIERLSESPISQDSQRRTAP